MGRGRGGRPPCQCGGAESALSVSGLGATGDREGNFSRSACHELSASGSGPGLAAGSRNGVLAPS